MNKQEAQKMRAEDFQTLLEIIGDLTYKGYRAALCHLRGKSLQSCANSLGLSKAAVRWAVENCAVKQHEKELRRIFGLPEGAIIAHERNKNG